MEDMFSGLPDELVTFEERQDLSQYSYDPTDMMENVNSDITLNGESSQPSSQEKLFDSEYFFGDPDHPSAGDGTDVDVLELLGITGVEQLPSHTQLDNSDQQDCKAGIDEQTVVSFMDDDLVFDVQSPGTSPGCSSPPDSTTFFAAASPGLDSCRLLQLSDDELLSLSTRELNRRIRHLSQNMQLQVKSRRRTLKNRGYAQTCRTRRVGQRHQLENDNERLHIEIQQLTDDKSKLLAECERLRREGIQYKAERDTFQSRLVGLLSVLAENGIVVQEGD